MDPYIIIEFLDPILQTPDMILSFLEQSLRELHQIPQTIINAYEPKPGSTAGTNIWKVTYQSAKNLVSLALWPAKKISSLASQPLKNITHPAANFIRSVRKNTTAREFKYFPQTTSELEKFADKYLP